VPDVIEFYCQTSQRNLKFGHSIVIANGGQQSGHAMSVLPVAFLDFHNVISKATRQGKSQTQQHQRQGLGRQGHGHH